MFPDLTRDDVFRIETARLWLRWPRLADAAAIARQAGEKAVAEMTARIPVGMSEAEAGVTIQRGRQANADGRALWLGIAPQSRPQELIGIVSIVNEGRGDPVLGFWLAAPFWGQGLMTEAAQALVDVAFSLTRIMRLQASVVPYNTASRRVLKKCGFAHAGGGLAEAPARGGPQAVDYFCLDRSTWAALKGWRDPRLSKGAVQALPEQAAAS